MIKKYDFIVLLIVISVYFLFNMYNYWLTWLRKIVSTVHQVFPSAKVKSSLRTIYENNVMGFGGGEMGAINGCKPDGRADRTTVQSEEFWTGVSYALSANFLQEVSV